MLKRKHIRVLRILLLFALLLGYLPAFLNVGDYVSKNFGDNGFSHVEEIKPKTYELISQADEIFEELPYDSRVKEVYVRQVFDGDTYLSIYVEVPSEQTEEMKQWLDEREEIYQQNGNIFEFFYFDSEHAYYFDNLVANETETRMMKGFNLVYLVLLILMLLPFELLQKRK